MSVMPVPLRSKSVRAAMSASAPKAVLSMPWLPLRSRVSSLVSPFSPPVSLMPVLLRFRLSRPVKWTSAPVLMAYWLSFLSDMSSVVMLSKAFSIPPKMLLHAVFVAPSVSVSTSLVAVSYQCTAVIRVSQVSSVLPPSVPRAAASLFFQLWAEETEAGMPSTPSPAWVGAVKLPASPNLFKICCT